MSGTDAPRTLALFEGAILSAGMVHFGTRLVFRGWLERNGRAAIRLRGEAERVSATGRWGDGGTLLIRWRPRLREVHVMFSSGTDMLDDTLYEDRVDDNLASILNNIRARDEELIGALLSAAASFEVTDVSDETFNGLVDLLPPGWRPETIWRPSGSR